jgi:hypothetical protein
MVRRMKCAEYCVQQQKISSTDSEVCKGALWHRILQYNKSCFGLFSNWRKVL